MLEGIDVSHWQTKTPSLDGLSFLIAKATEGTTRDPLYSTHIRNARAAGLVVGAYHFSRDDVQVAAQVNAFLAAVAGVRWLAFDVEGAHAWSLFQTRQAITQVHDEGLEVGLYMSESTFMDAGQDWSWVANWSHPPRRPWDVWQHRGSPLDLDRFAGSLDELRTLAHQQPEAPMTTAKLTYHQQANARTNRQVVDRRGQVIHHTPAIATSYPLIATDAVDYEIRLPGDVAGWIRKADVGSITPIPDPPAPDCTAVEHELELANGRIHQAITALGGTPT